MPLGIISRGLATNDHTALLVLHPESPLDRVFHKHAEHPKRSSAPNPSFNNFLDRYLKVYVIKVILNLIH